MDGASQDAEGLSLQSELRRVGPQTLHTAHSSHFRAIPAGAKYSFQLEKELVEVVQRP